MTSSPGPIPAATQSMCSPAVPLETAAAYGAPTASAKASSKRSIVGPSESRPEREHLDDELLLALVEPGRAQADAPGGFLHARAGAISTTSSQSDQRSSRPFTTAR